ncbi:MAG: hypothetical protein U0N82_07300 [Oscillospiraceae bacterium]
MANYELVNADQLDADLTSVGNAIRSKGGTSEKLSFPSGMVSAIGAISTGVELNFDVVGGTSQPSNPKENMIWVNTSTTISSWVFSATQPSNPSNGMVWIPTGTSSPIEFNALKKNGIQVYPISAKQYVSGVWANVAASVYQDSAWTVFSAEKYYLFQSGVGVSADCVYGSGEYTEMTVNSSKITTEMNDITGPIEAYLRTKNKIDLTTYSTMCMECICDPLSKHTPNADTLYDMGFGLSSYAFTNDNIKGDGGTVDALNVAVKFPTSTSIKKTFKLDVSRKNGSYYAGFSGCANATIYNIWLE